MRPFRPLFSIFPISPRAYLTTFAPFFLLWWFVCFFSRIALSSELAYLVLCSVRHWPEAPINFDVHYGPGPGSLQRWEEGIQCSHYPSSAAALWKYRGPAGTLVAIARSATILPPSSVPSLGVCASSVCPPLPSLLSVQRLFQNTKPSLVSRVFQCLSLSA